MSKSTLTRVPAILVLFMAITMVLGLMVAILLWSNGVYPQQTAFANPGPYDNRIVPGYFLSAFRFARADTPLP